MVSSRRSAVTSELCPDGIWRLSDGVRRVLNRAMQCLPKGSVSEDETRYPTTRTGMRAFLDKFFARHYFQIQDSLVDHVVSNDFREAVSRRHLHLLDLGCGPAVGSLAISELVRSILSNAISEPRHGRQMPVTISYVLNDTSDVCLGTATEFLDHYLQVVQAQSRFRLVGTRFAVEKPFPSNLNQLARLQKHIGAYDFIVMSYVAIPLEDGLEREELMEGLHRLRDLCGSRGKLIIIQDQFRRPLVSRISRMIGQQFSERTLRQYVYSSDNRNSVQSYSYFRCICGPGQDTPDQKSVVT